MANVSCVLAAALTGPFRISFMSHLAAEAGDGRALLSNDDGLPAYRRTGEGPSLVQAALAELPDHARSDAA